MRFAETYLKGAWLIEPVPLSDARGFFARTFCMREFASHGLEISFVQNSTSYSAQSGTLRGLHFQREPHSEAKLVSCLKGAIWDVIVDLRQGSETFGAWAAFELTAENRRQLYIPRGFAHGFQTLRDHTEVSYLISEFYDPESADGIRFDDPALAIDWPLPVSVISEKDKGWRELNPQPA